MYGGVCKGYVCPRWGDCAFQELSFLAWVSYTCRCTWRQRKNKRQRGRPVMLLGSILYDSISLLQTATIGVLAGGGARRGTSWENPIACFTLLSPRLESLPTHLPPDMQCFWLSYAWFIPLAWMTTMPIVNFLYNYRSKCCSRRPREASGWGVSSRCSCTHS